MQNGIITGQDLLGFPVHLHFNGYGDRHKTWCGGCCTVILKIFFAWYILTKVMHMVTFQDTSINQYQTLADHIE